MAEESEPIEAVIISGPRRGEIVRLSPGSIPKVTAEDLKLLNDGLDLVQAAIDRLDHEIHTTIEAFRTPRWERQETSGHDELKRQVAEVRERLARLEAFRDADRAWVQADLAQFKLEVEKSLFEPASQPPGPN